MGRDLKHGLLLESPLVLLVDFAYATLWVITRRRQDDQQFGAFLPDLPVRTSPLSLGIEDGQAIGKPWGYGFFKEGVPRRIVHDLILRAATAHEQLVLDELVLAFGTGGAVVLGTCEQHRN